METDMYDQEVISEVCHFPNSTVSPGTNPPPESGWKNQQLVVSK